MAKRHFQLNDQEIERFRQAEQQTRDVLCRLLASSDVIFHLYEV